MDEQLFFLKDKTPYNFLVVEDNPGDFLLVEDYLEETILTPNITQAFYFKEAKQILEEENNYDIILLDLTLPDHGGQALIEDVLQLAKDIPTVILTGYQNMEFAAHALTLGVSDYLLKDNLNATILYKSILYGIKRNKILKDIRESEKRYIDLFQLSPLPKWLIDEKNHNFLDVNNAALEKYGYTREEFLNLELSDIIHHEDLDEFLGALSDANLSNLRFRNTKKSGEIIHAEISSSKFKNKTRTDIMIVANDITENIQAQEELMNITFQVEDQERSRLSASLHDGLQQVLLAALKHFESVDKQVPHAFDQKYQERFHTGVDILRDCIQQTRSMAHELMPPDLANEGIAKAVSKMLQRHTNAGSSISFEFYENIGKKVISDSKQLMLYRIIQEMINNIIKHSQATESSVELDLYSAHINLIVIDNGQGFDPASITEVHSFGLSAIKKRINTMNGSIQIHSQLGKGTKIEVSIPL